MMMILNLLHLSVFLGEQKQEIQCEINCAALPHVPHNAAMQV
jgi:hypothetical protein